MNANTATIELHDSDSPLLQWRYRISFRNAEGRLLAVSYAEDVLIASLIANALTPNVEVKS
jgi:hypothetical protein